MKRLCKWSKTNDYYNREAVTQDVWSRKCRRGKIYLIDNPCTFTYTFSCGANSDYSFTGCLAGCNKVTSVEQAMAVIDKIAAGWLNNRGYASILKKYSSQIENIPNK
jgi:hypothetical protein